MLDDDQRVAKVPQAYQSLDQPPVVALVQTDRRLVQHVQDANQAGTDLGRQPDALRLTTGQCAGRAVQRQVVQTDIEQEPQSFANFLENSLGDRLLAAGQLHRAKEIRAFVNGHRADFGNVLAANGDGENLGLQPSALTDGTRNIPHVTLVTLLAPLALGFLVPALDERHDTFERRIIRALAAIAVLVAYVDLRLVAVKNRFLGACRQLFPRRVQIEVECVTQSTQQAVEILHVVTGRPRLDGATGEGLLGVGHQQLRVDLLARTNAAALRARAIRSVEGERPRLQLLDAERVVVRAGQLLRIRPLASWVVFLQVHELGDHDAVGQPQRGLHRVGQPALGAGLHREPVDDHLNRVLDLLLQRRRLGQ